MTPINISKERFEREIDFESFIDSYILSFTPHLKFIYIHLPTCVQSAEVPYS